MSRDNIQEEKSLRRTLRVRNAYTFSQDKKKRMFDQGRVTERGGGHDPLPPVQRKKKGKKSFDYLRLGGGDPRTDKKEEGSRTAILLTSSGKVSSLTEKKLPRQKNEVLLQDINRKNPTNGFLGKREDSVEQKTNERQKKRSLVLLV